MGEAFIMRRLAGTGSGAVGGYAVIGVSFPAGSTCTCAGGDTRFTAKDTSGAAAFAVPAAGTWTVTCTDGTHSKSRSVTITRAGQVECVILSYELALLSPEDGLAPGFSLTGNAAVSGNAILENGNGGFYFTPMIDLTDYTQLSLTGILRAAASVNSRICVGSSPENVRDIIGAPELTLEWPVTAEARTLTLDVSALTGSWYIGSTQVNNNLELTAVTLS